MEAIFEAALRSAEEVARLLRSAPESCRARLAQDHLVEAIPHWLYVGDTGLHLAAAAVRLDEARLLLLAGADPKCRESPRRHPLALCVRSSSEIGPCVEPGVASPVNSPSGRARSGSRAPGSRRRDAAPSCRARAKPGSCGPVADSRRPAELPARKARLLTSPTGGRVYGGWGHCRGDGRTVGDPPPSARTRRRYQRRLRRPSMKRLT
jgi:hypothetical protein